MPKLWITRRSEPTKYAKLKKKNVQLKNESKIKGYKCTIFCRLFAKTINKPFSKHGANKWEFQVFPSSVKSVFETAQ